MMSRLEASSLSAKGGVWCPPAPIFPRHVPGHRGMDTPGRGSAKWALSCGLRTSLTTCSLLAALVFGHCHAACGILVPWAGIKLGSWQWMHLVLTTGPRGNFSYPFLSDYSPSLNILYCFLHKTALPVNTVLLTSQGKCTAIRSFSLRLIILYPCTFKSSSIIPATDCFHPKPIKHNHSSMHTCLRFMCLKSGYLDLHKQA